MRCKLESVNEEILSLRPRLERLGVVSICFVGLADLRSSSTASARARSSHLSRTVSTLAPGRCEGVHRLVAETTGGLEPVVFGLTRDVGRDEMEEFREFVDEREAVRWSRRVWYAKASRCLDGDDGASVVDGISAFGFSMSCQSRQYNTPLQPTSTICTYTGNNLKSDLKG